MPTSSGGDWVKMVADDEIHFLPGSLQPALRCLINGADVAAKIKIRKINLLNQVMHLSKAELYRDNVPHRLRLAIEAYHVRENQTHLHPDLVTVSNPREPLSHEMIHLLQHLHEYVQQSNGYILEVRELFCLLRSLGDAKCLCSHVDISGDDIVTWKSLRSNAMSFLSRYAAVEKDCLEMLHFLRPAKMGDMSKYQRGEVVSSLMNLLGSFLEVMRYKQACQNNVADAFRHLRGFLVSHSLVSASSSSSSSSSEVKIK